MPQTTLRGRPLPASRAVADELSVLTGADCLARIGDELDRLHGQVRTPITARRAWLEAWVAAHPRQQVVLVVVRRAGRLVAAAPLARQRRFGLTVVRPLGDGPSDDIRFPARDEQAAAELARGLQQTLDRMPGPWVLVLRNLGPDPLVLQALSARLRCSTTTPGDAALGLHLTSERTLRAHVPASMRKAVQRRQRRMTERHGQADVEHLRDPGALLAVLPEVEQVCRRRDAAVGRVPLVDDPVFRSFLHELVPRLAARDELELTTVRVGGVLTGYALCLLDGSAHRLWHGRFDPAWDMYSLGHVVNLAALQRALDDPSCRYFDWMRGEEPYKRSLSDGREQLTHLVAGSGGLRWVVAAVPSALRVVRSFRARRSARVHRASAATT